jgi:hypothetical protein
MTDPFEYMMELREDAAVPLFRGWQRGKQDAGLGSGSCVRHNSKP